MFTDVTLKKIDEALQQYLENRKIFQDMGVQMSFSFPRLHSIVHYNRLIRYFGAPNGICTSITENKHIEAVKRPWRRSNRYNAISQMLTTNTRLDKLRASRLSFKSRGMLDNPLISEGGMEDATEEISLLQDNNEALDNDDNDDDGAEDGPTVLGSVRLALTPRKLFTLKIRNNLKLLVERQYPHHLLELSKSTGFENLGFLVWKFLYRQIHPEQQGDVPSTFLPDFNPKVCVFHSATATFHAPSDPSGTGGMRREQIRSTPSWRKGSPRYDTVFVETDSTKPGMLGMHVARVFMLFSFELEQTEYPCALVNWFAPVSETPDELTGMWMVSPEINEDDGEPSLSAIHINSILRAAHLIPYFGDGYVADIQDIDASQSLDNFTSYYVNRYIDHHAYEIVF